MCLAAALVVLAGLYVLQVVTPDSVSVIGLFVWASLIAALAASRRATAAIGVLVFAAAVAAILQTHAAWNAQQAARLTLVAVTAVLATWAAALRQRAAETAAENARLLVESRRLEDRSTFLAEASAVFDATL